MKESYAVVLAVGPDAPAVKEEGPLLRIAVKPKAKTPPRPPRPRLVFRRRRCTSESPDSGAKVAPGHKRQKYEDNRKAGREDKGQKEVYINKCPLPRFVAHQMPTGCSYPIALAPTAARRIGADPPARPKSD